MYTVIGTCSLCGGEVRLPTVWHGFHPPQPTCANCGATAAPSGPVIPMVPAGKQYTTGDTKKPNEG